MNYLLINQTFLPDTAATAQYLGDLAGELRSQGHTVTVLCSQRSYTNRTTLFAATEDIGGVLVERVYAPYFSEKRRTGRVLNALLVNISLVLRCLRLADTDVMIACSSPPLLGWFMSLVARLKSTKLILFVMDLNPDQAIAAGWIPQSGALANILKNAWRSALGRAHSILCLDSAMKRRILSYGVSDDKVKVVDLWWDQHLLRRVEPAKNRFVREHSLEDKFVILYAGNHSLCHPLESLLEVARVLRDDSQMLFLFVGGGPRVQEVSDFAQRHNLTNILQLPYYERAVLSDILSAAQVHVVSLGERYHGIVHPCKFYNALGVGARLIVFGPQESYLLEFARQSAQIHYFRHGQVADCVQVIRYMQAQNNSSLDEGYQRLRNRFSSDRAREKLAIELSQR